MNENASRRRRNELVSATREKKNTTVIAEANASHVPRVNNADKML